MNIEAALSVGSVYQNVAFYSLLILMTGACIELFKIDAKEKKLRAAGRGK